MTNKSKITAKDIYLLRLYGQLLFGLLDSVSSGYRIHIDSKINSQYLKLCLKIEELVGSKRFQKPFNSLFYAGEDIDSDWEGARRNEMLNFLNWVDELFEKSGRKRYALNQYNKEEKNLVIQTYQLLKAYKKFKQKLDTDFQKNLDDYVLQSIKDDTVPNCWFTGNSFSLKLANKEVKSLPFGGNPESNRMMAAFRASFDYWKIYANEEGIVYVPREKLHTAIRKASKEEVSDNSFKSTLSNLRKRIRETEEISSYVKLGYFNREKSGYSFQVKTS